MRLGGKGFLLFARLQPDTPGKLLAHALSYEALELAAYELLARVAERATARQNEPRRIAGFNGAATDQSRSGPLPSTLQ